MTRWVVDLEDPAAGNADLVGGKAYGLHRLTAAGLTVPDAFVVTTDAFRAHFPDAEPGRRPPAPPFQLALAQALNGALAAHFAPNDTLAVRSSAVGEDDAGSSFAGQHETYYYISTDGVAQAVSDCWLSLWSARAEHYRLRQGQGEGFAMAVIVQRMLQASRSGVCFTADPTGRDPEHAWIEAAWGLGAALVDGRVSPDRVLLDRDGHVLRRHVGRKRHRVAAGLRRPGEVRLEPVPLFQQTQAVLTDAEAADVLRNAMEAEQLFGVPQDVEWAYEDGRLQLLQSRPITALPGRDTAGPRPFPLPGRWVLFKPLAENFTESLTPVTVDLFRRVLPPGLRFVDGRLYIDAKAIQRLCPFRWTQAELEDALLLRGAPPPMVWDWRKLPAALLALGAAYLLDGISWQRTAHLTRAGLAEYAVLCHRLCADESVDALQALQRLIVGEHPFEPMGRRAYYVNVSAGRYFLFLGLLNALVARWAPDFDRHQLARLCSGDGGTFSRRLVEGVRQLADAARGDEVLRRRFETDEIRDLTDSLAALPGSHPFAVALESFQAVFGHRCLREMELAVPRWREDPLPLLLMVRSHLRANPSPAPDPGEQERVARESLDGTLPRRWQRFVAHRLISRVRYYTSLREDTRHYHAMAMDVTRRKLLALEQTLIGDERLRLAGDVFYLSWDECRALGRGRLQWRNVAGRIRRRRRRERDLARRRAPELLGGSVAEVAGHADGPGADGGHRRLTGECASPGSAEGVVRIVLDPSAGHDMRGGDVLVAPYTDPAWTPLFPLAAAVVVEVGSFLSHAGTVAREYGIPCLVEVAGCTERLRDGQRVRVRADDGLVEVLEP